MSHVNQLSNDCAGQEPGAWSQGPFTFLRNLVYVYQNLPHNPNRLPITVHAGGLVYGLRLAITTVYHLTSPVVYRLRLASSAVYRLHYPLTPVQVAQAGVTDCALLGRCNFASGLCTYRWGGNSRLRRLASNFAWFACHCMLDSAPLLPTSGARSTSWGAWLILSPAPLAHSCLVTHYMFGARIGHVGNWLLGGRSCGYPQNSVCRKRCCRLHRCIP